HSRSAMTGGVTTERGERSGQPISRGVSVARGLIRRDELMARLDRDVAKRVTIISASPGSGKTSLLRAWARPTTSPYRGALVLGGPSGRGRVAWPRAGDWLGQAAARRGGSRDPRRGSTA